MNSVDETEVEQLQRHIDAFQQGKIDESRFVPLRLQQGVYGQRQADVQMLRIKVPGGSLSACQLEAVAQVIDRFSAKDTAHLTTRQDIQVYDVDISVVPEALRILADAGLTTREACGNTVRNITACQLAGVCPHEHTDVRAYVKATMGQLLRNPLTQHLPRKFKISFSGCEADCAQGLIHDLAVIATWQNEAPGFRLLAAGGLGHKQRQAIVLEEFIPKEQLSSCIEAVLWVHNRYSNRRLRARSRLKFLVDEFGESGFIERYQTALKRIIDRSEKTVKEQAVWKKSHQRPASFRANDYRQYPIKINQTDKRVMAIDVSLGDLSVMQMQSLARLMNEYKIDDIRVTQDQNLLLVGILHSEYSLIEQTLKDLGLTACLLAASMVACPGTSTCRLGITSSKALAAKLAVDSAPLRVHIAGCQNGCAQPEVADVGLYGEGKRHHGQLVPFYQTWIGGSGHWQGAFAMKGPSVPVQRVETFMRRVRLAFDGTKQEEETFFRWSRRQGQAFFHHVAEDLQSVTVAEISSLAVDIDETTVFKVEQFGGGECAGIADALVDASLSEMRYEQNCCDAYAVRGDWQEVKNSLINMLTIAAGIGLLAIEGRRKKLKSVDDRGQWLSRMAQTDSRVSYIQTLQRLWQTLSSMSGLHEAGLCDYFRQFDRWRRSYFHQQGLEALLDTPQNGNKNKAEKVDEVIDLRDYACPMHYLKARKFLQGVGRGERRTFLFLSGEPAQQAMDSLKKDGHQVRIVFEQEDRARVQVIKL